MFIKIRSTHFPIDSIDQIDDIGGRVRVTISTGIKIDLDPIEAEKVMRQVESMNVARLQPETPPSAVILARVSALEARVMSLQASLLALEATRAKPKVKSNA
jgi:small-conductance mechanosensitive channel